MRNRSEFMKLVIIALVVSGANQPRSVMYASAQEQEQEEEQVIECSSVPTKVHEEFKRIYSNAKIDSCAKEVEQGRTAYEISSIDENKRRDVLFYEDGKLVVEEEAISPSELPELVRQAAEAKFPGHGLQLAEKLTRDGTVSYELFLTHQGKQVEISFDPSGKEIVP